MILRRYQAQYRVHGGWNPYGPRCFRHRSAVRWASSARRVYGIARVLDLRTGRVG